jgi:hypothetical protein
MKDGSYVVFQAKRSCGNDRSLISTVHQWEKQCNYLRDGDRVALVVRNPRGPVRDLQAALHDLRTELPGPDTEAKRKAIQAVRRNFTNILGSTSEDALLRAAHCVICAAEKPGDAQFDIAVSLLDGVIVPAGLGEAAFKLLQRNFQENAAAGEGSGIAHWIGWLSEAGYSPQGDPHGSPGQKVAAENLALAEYRKNWAKKENKLYYALLAQDLPAIEVPRLARTFQVSIASSNGETEKKKSLLAVARRLDRFILVGLPGSGKSTAIKQVAANWAARADAPTPIVISLQEVAQRITDPSQVTRRLLLDIATSDFDPHLQESLLRALNGLIDAGEVAIFLDGLDECRQLVGVVSLGLIDFLQEIDPIIPVVVTARDNALPAARNLGFTELRLAEPELLDRTMVKILEAVADVRVPRASRDSWLEVKRQCIEDARDNNSDIWHVPLLATLLTLLISSTDIDIFPQSRAQILLEVVRDSVRKWEVNRLTIDPPGSWNESLRPAHLIDGFAAIGHAISGTTAVSARQVDDAVVLMLRSRWSCSTGEAEALAPQIRWFWDERVGVFVVRDNGRRMEARSRQFVEIAEAMWVVQQSVEDVSSWLASAINDATMEDTVSLASGLSSDVTRMLLDVALGARDPNVQARGLLWLLKAEVDDQKLPAELVEQLIIATCSQYRKIRSESTPSVERGDGKVLTSVDQIMSNVNARQMRVDGFGWTHLAYLARVKFPSDARQLRDQKFSSLNLVGIRNNVLRALAALTDADADHRALSHEEVGTVAELLRMDIDLPDRQPPTQVSRSRVVIHPSDPLITGHAEAATLALRHLGSFSDDVLEHLRNVAKRGPASNYPTFAAALGARGVSITSGLEKSVREFARLFGEGDGWSGIIEPVAVLRIREGMLPPSRRERWKMSSLVGLMEAMGVAEVEVGDYRVATESDASRLPSFISAFASVCGFDVSSCALQAKRVLDTDEDERREEYDALFAALGERDPEFTQATKTDIEALTAGLSFESDWIAHLSCWVLSNLKDESTIPHLSAIKSSARPRRKRLATIALCANSPSAVRACKEAVAECDPAVRAGAADLVRMVAPNNTDFDSLRVDLSADADMTVRWAVSHDKELSAGGSYWSCPECSARNDPDDLDCPHCPTGERPFD